MILRFFLCFSIICGATLLVGQNYFQQQVDYDLQAELDTEQQLLKVQGTMTYHNNSNDPLDHLIMHLWWNAFGDKQSAFARQQFEMKQYEFHFASEADMGKYENLVFSDKEGPLVTTACAAYPFAKDIARLNLKADLAPGQSIQIQFQYTLDLPPVFSRPGYDGNLYRMTQWYPKPAVYDNDGWHPMPYLSIGEFYAEYGDYTVALELPAEQRLSHTGIQKELSTSGSKKIYSLSATNVLDFAWFASPKYELAHKIIEIENQEIKLHLLSNSEEQPEIFFEYMQAALEFYSKKIGLYPYPQYSLVYDVGSDRGGMEYPMISMVDMSESGQNLDNLIAHEIGHNWFQSALGSNERDYPWLDEGLNSFYERAYNNSRYPEANFEVLPGFIKSLKSELTNLQSGICHLHCCGLLGAIDQKSQDVDLISYGSNSYERMAWSMAYLQGYLGEAVFDGAMQKYYKTWLHQHPGPEVLQSIFENESGVDLDWFFQDLLKENKRFDYGFEKVEESAEQYLITLSNSTNFDLPIHLSCYDALDNIKYNRWYSSEDQQGIITLPKSDITRITINGVQPFLDNDRTNNHFYPKSILKKIRSANFGFLGNSGDSRYNTISMLPVGTYNVYDGLMLGLNMHSDFFPYRKTRWYVQPQLGLKSRELVGNFGIERDLVTYENPGLRKITFGLNGKRYNYFRSNLITESLAYYKLESSLTLHLKSKMLESKKLSYNFHFISAEKSSDIVSANSAVHQLNFSVEKPTRFGEQSTLVQAEYERYDPLGNSMQSYLKLSLEHMRSIQYRLDTRFFFRIFAGYFPINSRRDNASYAGLFSRGSIALTQQGYTDHTFQGSYLGRSKLEDWTTQQFSEEEGGFKLPVGAAYSNVGNSNDLGLTLNLKCDLPIKALRNVGLRPWADLGMLRNKPVSNAPLKATWYYAAGLSLELGKHLGVYYPLIYSSEFDVPMAGKNFFEKLSFRIDLLKLSFWDVSERPAFLL